MTPPRRTAIDLSTCRAEIYTLSIASWQRVRRDIVRLERQAFGEGAFEEGYLQEEFSEPENVAVILIDSKSRHIVGFTYAVPIDTIDPDRDAEWDETAYIGDTVVDEAYRGHGLVGEMMRVLEEELRRRGYRFLERDAAVAHDYAAKIARTYSDRIVAQSEPHQSPWGPQVSFRIRL